MRAGVVGLGHCIHVKQSPARGGTEKEGSVPHKSSRFVISESIAFFQQIFEALPKS